MNLMPEPSYQAKPTCRMHWSYIFRNQNLWCINTWFPLVRVMTKKAINVDKTETSFARSVTRKFLNNIFRCWYFFKPWSLKGNFTNKQQGIAWIFLAFPGLAGWYGKGFALPGLLHGGGGGRLVSRPKVGVSQHRMCFGFYSQNYPPSQKNAPSPIG